MFGKSALLIASFACAVGLVATAAHSQEAATIGSSVAYTQMPHRIAVEKGYFAAEGLTPDLKIVPAGNDVVQALAVRERRERLKFSVGQAAAGHPRDLQLLDCPPHVLRPAPVPTHMLIIEDRHDAPGLPEHVYNLVEQLAAGIQLLALRVERVRAVLTDDHDAVDRQLIASQAQSRRDGREERDVVFLRDGDPDVVPGDLHQMHRDNIAPRPLEMVVELLPFEELRAVTDAMAGRSVLRQDNGKLWPPAGRDGRPRLPHVLPEQRER